MNNRPSQSTDLEPLSRAQLLITIAVTALVLFMVARLWITFGDIRRLPIALDGLALAQGKAGGVGIKLASSLTYHIFPAYRRSADFYLEFVLKPLWIADTIWLGLLPGISEELLFRGVMLPAVGLNLWGVTLSSLCFGLLHISGIDRWAYMLWAAIVGFFLGLMALWTGNLLVPILAHGIANLVSSLIWKLRQNNNVEA